MPQITFAEVKKVQENGQFDQNSRLFQAYWSHLVYWVSNYYDKNGYFEIINNKIEHFLD